MATMPPSGRSSPGGAPKTTCNSAAAMAKTPELSVVVVGYRMQRELPRTLRSLSPAMQRGIRADQYEIILIDNGSPEPMGMEKFPAFGAQVSCHRIDNASASPAAAANFGLRQARGRLIGMMV